MPSWLRRALDRLGRALGRLPPEPGPPTPLPPSPAEPPTPSVPRRQAFRTRLARFRPGATRRRLEERIAQLEEELRIRPPAPAERPVPEPRPIFEFPRLVRGDLPPSGWTPDNLRFFIGVGISGVSRRVVGTPTTSRNRAIAAYEELRDAGVPTNLLALVEVEDGEYALYVKDES